MSSRALRKLERPNIEDELAKIASSIEKKSEDPEEHLEKKDFKHRMNAFSALLDVEEEEEEETPIAAEMKVSDETSSDEFVDAVQSIQSNRKGNKSRKSRKNRSKRQVKKVDDLGDDELDNLLSKIQIKDAKDEKKDEDDDLEQDTVTRPSPLYAPGGRLFTMRMFNRCSELVRPQKRYLDPDKEYEGLFGKLSSAAIEDADSTASSFITPEVLKQIKKLSKRVRGWGGRDRRSVPGTMRKLVLTKIRDDWLPTNKKPLVMEELTDSDIIKLYEVRYPQDWEAAISEQIKRDKRAGVSYFRLTEGPLYSRMLTTEFFISVAIQPDHESIMRLLQKAPYHLESILQVSSILQRQGDTSNTNGLIERGLFIFDWSLKNTFNLAGGKSRIPFEFYLNRQIYLTIFRYIKVLTKKSTFYTALNYTKLLFSFDPNDDPYGVRYFIDFYAFMSGDYQYLVDLYNSALIQCYEEWLTPSICFSAAYCMWKLGKVDEAGQMLEDAVLRHPYTAFEILSKLHSDSKAWNSSHVVSDSVNISTAIYMVRVNTLLEEPELRSFVVDKMKQVLASLDVASALKDHCYFNKLEEIPQNLLRHVVLSNETSAMAKIPESFWTKNEVYEFDVLPPEKGTKIYNYIDQNRVADAVMSRTMQTAEGQQIQELMRQEQAENE
ncbi:hypothetical protein FOA43_004540 [Brettanomyces nanus]|uniref:Uncharacterized protein n=1 Tax=Eeniella nana TaxID=13502 RepID=A0A875S719_EENNA|nr:uncharacterized protein FOA43_004540 [Brettanomyces nanus]QPG77136.1 hypothetical protein FOA43_004540 [Brettanomyces nanus]